MTIQTADFDAIARDMHFIISEVFPEPTAQLSAAELRPLIEQIARLAAEQMAPLNQCGDEVGLRLEDGEVFMPPGFAEAWRQIAEGGWLAIGGAEEFGGVPAPHVLRMCADELSSAANLSLGLFGGLTTAAALTIRLHATDELRQRCLPQLYRGQWSGAMCLTEAQAGSDLGLIRSRAEADGDGSYRLSGSKIFISAGRHDMVENIIYLVLARLPDAPPGPRGLSLFLVSSHQLEADGSLGAANTVRCERLERKMGMHASPTCVLEFRDAQAFLIGSPHAGLPCMFTMMNDSRLSVGTQGLGCAAAAYAHASRYAAERLQGNAPGAVDASGPQPIVGHADVRRMLLSQRALVEGARALALHAARVRDRAETGDADNTAQLQLLIPVVKSMLTDIGIESCLLAQQIYGGHGYIRDHGVEQLLRDVRVTALYEGTNGIQARDLLERKLLRDGGAAVERLCQQMERSALAAGEDAASHFCAGPLAGAVGRLRQLSGELLQRCGEEPALAGSAAVEYLQLFGYTALAWTWTEMVTAALRRTPGDPLREAKLGVARFYMARILPRIRGLGESALADSDTVMGLDAELF